MRSSFPYKISGSQMAAGYFSYLLIDSSVVANIRCSKQILVNVIGQAPMDYGIALLWPLVERLER